MSSAISDRRNTLSETFGLSDVKVYPVTCATFFEEHQRVLVR